MGVFIFFMFPSPPNPHFLYPSNPLHLLFLPLFFLIPILSFFLLVLSLKSLYPPCYPVFISLCPISSLPLVLLSLLLPLSYVLLSFPPPSSLVSCPPYSPCPSSLPTYSPCLSLLLYSLEDQHNTLAYDE